MADADETTVFIVEDHEVVRTMLVQLIDRTPGLSVSGVVATAEEALAAIPACQPHLVLVDLSLPGMDGTVLIQALHQRYPDLLILAVSGHDETLYAAAALSAGAQGYIMKEDSIQIPEAIRRLRRGERYVSDQLRSEFDDLE